ncbi:LysR substrate-binding domain-containing protein [Flavobacterium sp. TAB 87]|uniref:LysR substrate-binding domain-containing protein n=1 Tax=Flavobacterium sp. TAB 87 TaxID=1729581 RepID=UPI00076D8D88|nr:LysR substrate-binding domain-containing protein [Flavobacterium sp. TAB 87]KVV13655.1 Cyn operon transcriptional activator [Flavobacterium sp. TAB 87]
MELFQLRYFVALADVLHFTKAAEACFVTQSGLSQQIKKLEEELAMSLFLRIGKKVQLTEAGSVFLKHAKRILEDVESGKQAIDDLSNLIGGELRIGVTYIFGLLVLPVVELFANKYPDLKIIVEYGATEPLQEKLLKNELDLVLVISNYEIELPMQKIPLFTSKLVMAVSKTNDMAKMKSISFKKLQDIPLILPSKGFNSREFLDVLFAKNKISPKIPIELNAIHALLQIIENSDWATIVTEKALKGWHGLQAIELTGVKTERKSYIITIKNDYQKKAIGLFIDAFRKLVEA